MAEMVGRDLGHYRIAAKLGAGGMGEVYRAEDTTLGREVALKVLPAELAGSPERLERFRREARTLAAVDHPHIVHLYSVEEADGVHFLTMQLVRGETLEERIRPGGLSVEEFLELAIPLADALRAAHERGVTHRDLKPGNILIDEEGRVKVLDFGLAKLRRPEEETGASRAPTEAALTQEGLVLGTVPYMSPEQVQGLPLDHRTDLFSLGIVFFELLTGRRPFAGDNTASTISAILRDRPRRVDTLQPDLPPRLGQIVERCLEKDPEQRYSSARDLARDLEDFREEVLAGSAGPGVRPPARALTRFPRAAAIGLAALLVLLAAWTAVLLLRGRTHAPPPAAGPRISSLVILPLENFTGDPDQEYFADGMTDALITDLSKVGSLRVLSRTTAMRYKETTKTLPEIARELGVDAIVEGSVARAGERVAIKTQLVDPAADSPLWSETFERPIDQVLALHGEVARAIAEGAVRVTLTPAERERLTSERRVDPASYQAYLRGMYWLNKGTREGIERGMEYLHEAVEREPGDPLAYAGLALGYVTVAHGPEPPPDALDQARSAAEKAVRIDDTLAEAHAALAFLRGYYDREWELARETLDHALEINPGLAIAHYHDAWFHVLFGRMDEAIEAHLRAQSLDPLMPLHTAWLGELYRMAGRVDEAIAEAERAIAMAPGSPFGHFVLGLAYQDQGRHREAIAAYQEAAQAAPWRWALVVGRARAGETERAAELLRELEALPITPWRAFWLAVGHASLGHADEAFRWLDYEHPHAWVPWVRVLDWFGPLREDPRFDALLVKMNLPPLTD